MTDEDTPGGIRPVHERIEEEWDEKHARERGIYTDTDRKYLWGITTYEDRPEARSRRRKAIQDRTINGLQDLEYLPRIEPDRQEEIVDELQSEEAYINDIRIPVAHLIQFAYSHMGYDEEWLAETVAAGVVEAEREREGVSFWGPRADVEIEVSGGHNLDRLEERFRADSTRTLTESEIGALVKDGRVNPEDLERLNRSPDVTFRD